MLNYLCKEGKEPNMGEFTQSILLYLHKARRAVHTFQSRDIDIYHHMERKKDGML